METLILRHNSKQKRRAILAALGCVIGTAATYFFFHYAIAEVAVKLFEAKPGLLPGLGGMAAVLLLYWEGFRRAKHSEGLYEYTQSPLYLGLDWSNGGAMLVEWEMARITGVAYALTQLFLCGPLQLLKCQGSMDSLIPPHAGLAANLQQLLDKIVSKAKWQPVETYDHEYLELRQLISMELVEFSARQGMVKPAAHASDQLPEVI